MLTVAVAGALIGISAAYNPVDAAEARFGSARQLLRYDASDPQATDVRTAARAWFGTIDVIGHRYTPMPGLFRSIEIRAQDPHGPYGAPMLRLRAGRYPTEANEAALTDEVATLLKVRIGGRLELDGRVWRVVGLVENPANLHEEFVLVPPAHADPPESVTILTTASREHLAAFQRSANGTLASETRELSRRTTNASLAFGVVAMAMLLVSFVAAAGFVVLAQRRMRQFGLLAATGATGRHLRLVVLASGAMSGVVGAVLGAVAFAPLWIVITPRLESGTGHRIDRLNLPWWLVGSALLLAVVTATAAAWWPARFATRVPVVQALSMRPPRPRPAHHLAVVGALLLMGGAVCLRLARSENVLLIMVGCAATLLGLPFLGPVAIRALALVGARLPVAARLALRDLVRYQARSGAALAAISLALALSAFTVIVGAASANTPTEGNLSDRQLAIRLASYPALRVPDRTPAQAEAIETAVGRFTATLGSPTVIPLDVAVDPKTLPEPGFEGGPSGRSPVVLGIRDGEDSLTLPRLSWGVLYVATPELLRYLGLDPNAIGPGTDGLSAYPGADWALGGVSDTAVPATIVSSLHRTYGSLPDLLISPATLQRHGLIAARVGWLIETPRPLTEQQIAAAREMAVDNGLAVEARFDDSWVWVLRATAIAIGAVLSLGILAMTVGLIRGEARRDLQTLAATGATGKTRRTLTATTAGALALLGAVLAISVAYLTLVALNNKDLGRLSQVPIVELTVIAVGIPLTAATAAWLLAGREPRTLARTRLD